MTAMILRAAAPNFMKVMERIETRLLMSAPIWAHGEEEHRSSLDGNVQKSIECTGNLIFFFFLMFLIDFKLCAVDLLLFKCHFNVYKMFCSFCMCCFKVPFWCLSIKES